MKTLIAFALAAIAAGVAHARPIVIEPTSKIAIPDASYYRFVGAVAIDTDDAVIMGTKDIPDPSGNPDSQTTSWLFKRNGSNWDFVRQLATVIDGNEGDGSNSKAIHMRNGVAALAMQPLYIFERVNGEWVAGAGSPLFGDRGEDVVVQGYRIFFGELCWGGTIIERDADKMWREKQFLFGDFCGSTDGASGGPVGLWNNWAVVSNLFNEDGLPEQTLSMFRRNSSPPNSWVKQPLMLPPAGHGYGRTFMNNDEMYVADWAPQGTTLFARGTDDAWHEQGHLAASGDYMTGSQFAQFPTGGDIVATNTHVLRQHWDDDLQQDVVQVFQRNSSGKYEHWATLVAGDGGALGSKVAISGRRVLVNGDNGAYYFTLPDTLTSPAVIEDSFLASTATGWTPSAGSQFAVVQSGNTRVYRQSSTVGDAASVRDASDWTNQSIQADVKPTAVNGSDRWVGLATRRVDASNYYYVTLRSSGIIALKVLHAGQFTNLDSATYPFALNTTHRLRLESLGTLHRVYVDGNLVLEARNADLKHGRAGLLTFRAAADFDNVIVSPSGLTKEYVARDGSVFDPPQGNSGLWEFTGGSWAWENTGSTPPVFVQSSLTGDGRAAVGAPAEGNGDHIVEVRARSRAFGTVSDPWFGVMTRYSGPTGYIYLSLRRSNQLTLRRVSGQAIEQLGAVPFTVTPGTWYQLRLEAVGTRLRAFVNGRLMLETTVSGSATGGLKSGLVTYGMSAEYDDYLAVRP